MRDLHGLIAFLLLNFKEMIVECFIITCIQRTLSYPEVAKCKGLRNIFHQFILNFSPAKHSKFTLYAMAMAMCHLYAVNQRRNYIAIYSSKPNCSRRKNRVWFPSSLISLKCLRLRASDIGQRLAIIAFTHGVFDINVAIATSKGS